MKNTQHDYTSSGYSSRVLIVIFASAKLLIAMSYMRPAQLAAQAYCMLLLDLSSRIFYLSFGIYIVFLKVSFVD